MIALTPFNSDKWLVNLIRYGSVLIDDFIDPGIRVGIVCTPGIKILSQVFDVF